MKLLSVSKAKSIWLLPVEDLNPRGLDTIPVLAAIQSRYRFQIYPTKPEDIYDSPNGIQFARGSFGLDDGQRVEVENATIYRDGITADTGNSTDVSDAFLNDVLTFLSQRHGLSFESGMIRRKIYLSELVVSTQISLGNLNEGLRGFSKLLADEGGGDRDFELTSIRFGTDPAMGIAIGFSFERREGSPFGENRYFSSAPLTTDKHLEVLNAWEKVLTK